uniref:Wsv447-like protein n=1 Tax=Metopaulias depressus WSSV-like virus TaxID=1675544 RepID=A0A0K0VLR3_9VIRU|nr:wsv447-like protein [Metopaulias depressus WSSV-like virus]
MLRHRDDHRDDKVMASYPFLATRTQVWRKAVTKGSAAIHPSTVVKLPENPAVAKNNLTSVSTQQALAARYLRNSMALSYASGGISVFHLGGLAGAGKTAIVKELIAELNDSKLIDTERDDILLCSKTNSAKTNLMSACETGKKGVFLYPARSFATLNSGFSIPVVHNRNEVTYDRITDSADWLKRKILDCGLGNLQFLAIDEYTMSSCREIVYIDAILRMIKFRPDIPFGGVFVLFIGDNRQNSAVVEDSNNGRKKAELIRKTVAAKKEAVSEGDPQKDKEEEEGFRRGGVEDEFNNNAKLYTDLFIKIMKNFASKDCFGNAKILKWTIKNRLDVLMKKEQRVASTNNDIVLAYDRCKKAKIDKKKEDSKVEKSNEDEFDSDDEIFSNELLLQMMDDINTSSSPPSSDDIVSSSFDIQHDSFSTRCKSVAEANIASKKREKEQKLEWEKMRKADILKCTPLSAVVEEGLKSEIEHLKCLKSMAGTNLEHYVRDIFSEIIKTATKAMTEIDYTGREKFYIVSSLSERFKDAHVTALMDEEILNAKLLFGHDKKCCDALPFKSEQKRSLTMAACVRNAFIRDGCEIKEQIPIAKYFMENLHHLADFLRDDAVSYKDMVEKSIEIKRILEGNRQQPIKTESKKIEQQQEYDDDDDDDHNFMDEGDDVIEEDEDYYCDDGGGGGGGEEEEEEEERAVSRPDVPQEVNVDSSTNERVGALVSFHVTWYKWLSSTQPSDLVRSRIWHLYMLVRIQQIKFSDNKLSSFDKAAASGRLFFPTCNWNKNTAGTERDNAEEDYHDEYWLRLLSMPVSAGGDTQQSLLLPAYSSYLSAVSRTYIMSSLKRVNVVKHSYALMYGVSLLDMTVDVNELVDSRQVSCFSKPIGYNREFHVEEYFDTIFRCMVDEYLMCTNDDVIAEASSVEKVKGSLKVSHAALLANSQNKQAAEKGGALKYTNKSVILAMRMLTSIAQGNMRSKLNEKKIEEDSQPEAKSLKQSLTDRFASKTAVVAAAKNIDDSSNKMMGAITLTRRHAQKDAVSHLVDASIINQSSNTNNGKDTANSIKTMKSDTKFVVKNIDVSYMNPETSIRQKDREKILEAIRHSTNLNKPFIDSVTDQRLLRESQNSKKFTKVLTDLRNKVTRVKSVNLYQGQNVVFTNTNVKQIHGTAERFVTKDTGVIIDIVVKNGATTVFVLVERLGKDAIQLTEGRHFLGVEKFRNNDNDGPRNAYVSYIPLDSSQAMTIYSCQGQTFCRDTIVDLTGASTQDAYVAITRNDDPLNLYVVQAHETEKKNLSNIKCSMGKDRASLLPLGGIGKLGGEEFANYDAINVAKEVLDSIIAVGGDSDEKSCQYSTFDSTRDMVTAAQRFIMNRSGNSLAFNSAWMENTSKILLKDGLSAELERIDEFFFGSEKSGYAKYYTDATNDKIMELFTAVTRSVTHYAMASGTHIKTPSLKLMEDHIKKHKDKKDYVKIHPCFLNASPMKDSLSSLFYDVAPHSKPAAVLQFYIHYLFLVYEKLHICNSSFAFLSSTSPVLNQHTRPDLKTCSSIQQPTSYTIYIPGGGLGYESRDFKESKDGGARDKILRVPLTTVDYLGDNIEQLRKTALASSTSYDAEKAARCTEYISKSMRHNLRRPGKFCRPHETCGLSKHGAIVVATKSEKIELSHVHENEKGWISLSNEVNMYGLLVFMTKLAAASGVTTVKLNNGCGEDGDILEPKEGRCGPVFAPLEDCGAPAEYQLRLSEEILWCGQVAPMERVQFTLHARVNQAAKVARFKAGNVPGNKIFSPVFEKNVLNSKKLTGAQVLMITEMLGRGFAQHTTSDIRSSLFHGVGKVLAKKTIVNTDNIIRQTEDFIVTKLKTTACARASFFVSLKH